jgi:hypothetical protein
VITTQVFDQSPSRRKNREMAEGFNGALYDRRVHAPTHQLALDELLFLQDLGYRVDHPTTGP